MKSLVGSHYVLVNWKSECTVLLITYHGNFVMSRNNFDRKAIKLFIYLFNLFSEKYAIMYVIEILITYTVYI